MKPSLLVLAQSTYLFAGFDSLFYLFFASNEIFALLLVHRPVLDLAVSATVDHNAATTASIGSFAGDPFLCATIAAGIFIFAKSNVVL